MLADHAVCLVAHGHATAAQFTAGVPLHLELTERLAHCGSANIVRQLPNFMPSLAIACS